MTRAVAISVVVALLVTGCVSLGPAQTTQPPVAPSFSITTPAASPSATAAPTASAPTATSTPEATPSAAATPTSGATETQAPPLTPDPSQAVIEDFGADELLFSDDFSDPTSGWGVGPNAAGTTAYVDGALQMDTIGEGYWMWSSRMHARNWPVLHVEASFTPSANGYVGLFCRFGDRDFWGGRIHADGTWSFNRLDDEGAHTLTSQQQAGWEILPGTTTRVALDCAGTDTGSLRLQLSLPDIGLAASYEGSEDEGDDRFDVAAVYTRSAAHPYSVRIDDVFVYGGEGETSMSPETQALLLHVPAAWRPDCFETHTAFDVGSLADVGCRLSEGRSDVVDFVQFDSQENMDAAYQTRVDKWAVESTDSCQTGPNEGGYTIGGLAAGSILCAPQTVGIRVDWTVDSLLILSTLTDFDGSYPDVYQDWLIAGPE